MYFIINNDTNQIAGIYVADDINNLPEYIKKECRLENADKFLSECKNDEEKIKVLFNASHLKHDYYPSGYNGYEIEIIWGDWKHDHLFCDDLMESIGYKLISEEITEEDGSDCYSAIRTYEKNKD